MNSQEINLDIQVIEKVYQTKLRSRGFRIHPMSSIANEVSFRVSQFVITPETGPVKIDSSRNVEEYLMVPKGRTGTILHGMSLFPGLRWLRRFVEYREYDLVINHCDTYHMMVDIEDLVQWDLDNTIPNSVKVAHFNLGA